MAKYESPRYPELGFYVDGTLHKFSGGLYVTDDPAVIAVLDELIDSRRIDDDEKEPEESPKAPAATSQRSRKPSGK